MPKVPDYNLPPLKPIYLVTDGLATIKQKNYIITLCERRKLPTPDFKDMSKKKAAFIISQMNNS